MLGGLDVNNDGYGDFIVTASQYSFQDSGKVWLYSGINDSLIWTSTGELSASQWGQGAVAIGDINNDQHDDFMIGGKRFHGFENIFWQ